LGGIYGPHLQGLLVDLDEHLLAHLGQRLYGFGDDLKNEFF